MKKTAILLASLLINVTHQSHAIVGYYNLQIYTGDNLIANQLNTTNNTIDNLLTAASSGSLLQDGTTFTKWNSATSSYLPLSVYDSFSDTWSINYSLNLGEGALLHSSSSFVNTFVGEVVLFGNLFGGPGPVWSPNYPDGTHLIASPVPISGPIDQLFYDVTGRNPHDGESVQILNPATQTSLTSTYDSGLNTWSNGDPSLGVGESAFFYLGVPEPSTGAFMALGGLLVLARRKIKR